MTALNKKWLSGLVAGALMAVSVSKKQIAGVEESRSGAAEVGRQTRSRQ